MSGVKTGIFPGMSRAEYDKIDALNISTLINGRESMAALKYKRDYPERSEALDIGVATHWAIYEPAQFASRVVNMGDTRRGTAAWKSQEKPGMMLLKDAAYQVCVVMRDKLRSHPIAREILDSKGVGEMAAVWTDKETGLLCKGMVDRFCQWHVWPLISDVKTCQCAHPKEFAKHVADFSYHVKAAWYLDALNIIQPGERRFMWLAVEKEPPHCVAVFEPTDDTLAEGRRIYRRLLDQYAKCKETDIWTGYGDCVYPLSIPKWAFENREEIA